MVARLAVAAVALLAGAGSLLVPAVPAGAAVTMTVTPDTGLTAVTTVAVHATGLTPSSTARIAYCNAARTRCRHGGDLPVDGTGALDSIAVAMPVLTVVVNGQPTSVDCRLETCQVVVTNLVGTALAFAGVTFTADADPTIGPATVTPSTGLVDGQVVDIDLPPGIVLPGASVSFVQCLAQMSDLCPSTVHTASASLTDGWVHTTLAVSRLIQPVEEPPDVDCVIWACSVALSSAQDGWATEVPLQFAPAPLPAAGYHGVTPTRVLDSRSGLGFPGPLTAGTPLSLGLTLGSFNQVTAVVLNVAVTNPTAGSFLTVWREGAPQPSTANLNFGPGETRANLVTVPVGVLQTVSFANAMGSTDVVADLVGYYTTDTNVSPVLFTGLGPTRVLDTRTGSPVVAGTPTSLPLAGVSGIPADATDVVANIAVTGSSSPAYLSAWPAGTPSTATSTVNFGPGETLSHLTILHVGTGGAVQLATSAGQVDVVVDVVGYFRSGGGSRFSALSTPVRMLDDRVGVGLTGPWQPGETRALPVAGVGLVPGGATGVVMNTTVTNGTAPSYLTVSPDGAAVPVTSVLNFGPDQTLPNLVVGGIALTGKLAITNHAGTVDVVGDVAGYFAP